MLGLAILYFLCGLIAGGLGMIYLLAWFLTVSRDVRVRIAVHLASKYPDEYLEAEEKLSCTAEEIHGDTY